MLTPALARLAARRAARCASLGLALAALVVPVRLTAAPRMQGASTERRPTAKDPAGAKSTNTRSTTTQKAATASSGTKPKATAKKSTAPASRRRTSRTARRPVKAVPVLRHTTPRGEIALAADLHALLKARTKNGAWGVMVASLSRGDTLFNYHGDAPMLPASTLKLFTTALAFDRLGPSHQLTTEILRDGTVSPDGTLRGSLYLRGGGDPSFSSRYLSGGPETAMRALAKLVADAGIKRVSGDIIGDASAFDAKRIPDGWLSRYLNDSYAARVSPLSLNENLLNVVINPGKSGRAGVVTLQPPTVAYKVVNNTRTVAGRAGRLVVSRTSDGTVIAKGTIGTRSEPKVYQVVVDDPALFTTGAFRKSLEREGVEVEGALRLGATPEHASRVGAYYSPPLATLAVDMNRESVNHIAELLFRDAARTAAPDGVGSAERANGLLRELLVTKAGVRSDAVSAVDGSGLSSLNRITPRALVQLLGFANRAPWAPEFHASLPVAGKSDMLRRRMTATPAQGNLHAKTGTTNEVIALGGYVTASNGELLAFSFLYNGRERWGARETIDAMGATLAGWSR